MLPASNLFTRCTWYCSIICREYVLYDKENKNRLDDCLSIYFVELEKGEDSTGESIKDLWIKLLANSKKAKEISEESPIIKKAVSKVYQISELDDIQFKVIEEALAESKRLDWEDDVLEAADTMVKEATEKAKKEAKEEAEEEANQKVKEAEQKAEQKAKEAEQKAKEAEQKAKEAEQKAKIDMAKSMLASNMDSKIIANITGLSLVEIEKLN